jgi:hypothetical protein
MHSDAYLYPRSPKGEGVYCFTSVRLSVRPSVLPSFRPYMKLVTKYQISAINSCWEKCDETCGYMFNVYENQLSRQTGSRNLTGPKTLPTIWYTYMTLVTKYQISVINSYWEKCDEKYLGWTDGRKDGRMEGRKDGLTDGQRSHVSSHFSQQLLMAEIWYLVTSFI